MKLVAQNNYVVCQQLNKAKQEVNESIIYNKEFLATYKILSIGNNLDSFRLSVGDVIICNSTGTKVILDDLEFYIFNNENIIGKIS